MKVGCTIEDALLGPHSTGCLYANKAARTAFVPLAAFWLPRLHNQ